MKRDATALTKRYQDDHVFRSLVDVIASHFRINLGYSRREVMDAVAQAEVLIKEKNQKQYIEVEHHAC